MCREELCWWIPGISNSPHAPHWAGGWEGADSSAFCAASWDTSQLESRNATGKAARSGGFSCSLPGRPRVTQSCLSTEHFSRFLFCTQLLSFARAELSYFWDLSSYLIWTKLTTHLKYNKEGLISREHSHNGSGCLGDQTKGKSSLYESRLKILGWCHKSDLNTSDRFFPPIFFCS